MKKTEKSTLKLIKAKKATFMFKCVVLTDDSVEVP